MPRSIGDPKWKDPGLLVMGSLAGGPKHGYAMIQDIADSTGAVLGPGTLYGVISRLESRGLIEALETSDPRRRPYRLTDRGIDLLQAQTAEMKDFARLSRHRLAERNAASPVAGVVPA